MKMFGMKGIAVLKKKQDLLRNLFVGAFVVVVLLVGYLLFSDEFVSANDAKFGGGYSAKISSPTAQIDPQKTWVERLSSEQDLQKQEIQTIKKMLDQLIHLQQETAKKEKNENNYAPRVSQANTSSGMRSAAGAPNTRTANSHTPIDEIQNEITQAFNKDFIQQPVRNSTNNSFDQPPQKVVSNRTPHTQSRNTKNNKRPHTRGIQRTSLGLVMKKELKTADNTIPSGAFAQAICMGGVDASTGVNSSGDPRPILLRVTDLGTLPRRFRSDLKGCHLLAASYGDISAERVFMRLEKLTCTERKTGEIVEMNVEGYVAGEDGRAGLRGTVVDRAGPSVRNAAIGGFLGGMGDFLSQGANTGSTLALGSGLVHRNPLNNREMLMHGATKGASSALDKYADFYIKRAEQMQPVIQVESGRVVDIIFTKSTKFESSMERGALIHRNDRKRVNAIQGGTRDLSYWTQGQMNRQTNTHMRGGN